MKQRIVNIEEFEKLFSKCKNNQERLYMLLEFEYGLKEDEIRKITMSCFRNLV
jgi:hypothetical protein